MSRLMIFAFSLLAASCASAASFDCSGKLEQDEKIVCNDKLLSSLDSRLMGVHAAAKQNFADAARDLSSDFLADRKSCGADRQCILATYMSILANMGEMTDVPKGLDANTIAAGKAKPSKGLPEKIGQCVFTKIDQVHPRVGDGSPEQPEDYDAGTGVDFANDGYQVSYDREEALMQSKPGDTVTMCLVSMPHRCPPGEDGGRGYFTTNQRTHLSWAMYDSQHACGM
jgi:uncharacterized protein